MGCTSSVVSPEEDEQTKRGPKRTRISKEKNLGTTNVYQNGHNKKASSNNTSFHGNNQNVDKNGNKLNTQGQTPVPKSIAFDVTLDGLSGDGLLKNKRRQPRLSLEPLNIPSLTSEQLQEKQRLADEKRAMLKQRKISQSQKSYRRRRELLEAREFDQKQLTEQDKDLIDSMKQAELNREQRLIEIREKQRLREERAKRARERAKNMQNPEDDVEVEKDEEFNASNDDTWLGIPDKTSNNMEEEYGLQKKVGQMRPTASARTVDSYDAAFMRNSTQEKPNLQPAHHHLLNNVHIMNDDFFDS